MTVAELITLLQAMPQTATVARAPGIGIQDVCGAEVDFLPKQYTAHLDGAEVTGRLGETVPHVVLL